MEPQNAPNREVKSLSSSSSAVATTSSMADQKSSRRKNKRATTATALPSPKELISHYESKGMDTQQASVKVIQDLQNIIFRIVTSSSGPTSTGWSGKGGQPTAGGHPGRKLDVLNARLINIDMKLDSKPGYPQVFAIGVASSAALRGFDALFPHLAGAFSNIWNAVSSATSSS